MRIFLYGLMIAAMISPAYAATRSDITGVTITGDENVTNVRIGLSAGTPFTATMHNGELDIDIPAAIWLAGVPRRGSGGALAPGWRKEPAARGVRIAVRLDSGARLSATSLDTSSDGLAIVAVLLPVAPPPVVAVPDYGPVVLQTMGVPVLSGQAVATPAAPKAAGPASAPNPSTECTTSRVQTGSLNGVPVYSFSGCARAGH